MHHCAYVPSSSCGWFGFDMKITKTLTGNAMTISFRSHLFQILRCGAKLGLALALAVGISNRVNAATIFVGNASFETPATPFAGPEMDAWQKSPQPFWFPPGTNSWDQTMGQFLNTPDGSPGHITNIDGK